MNTHELLLHFGEWHNRLPRAVQKYSTPHQVLMSRAEHLEMRSVRPCSISDDVGDFMLEHVLPSVTAERERRQVFIFYFIDSEGNTSVAAAACMMSRQRVLTIVQEIEGRVESVLSEIARHAEHLPGRDRIERALDELEKFNFEKAA